MIKSMATAIGNKQDALTVEELQLLIDIVARYTVPVAQAPPYIELINKLSRMIDELRAKS
jgi:hypothetical protein